jgi:hypothetical protein
MRGLDAKSAMLLFTGGGIVVLGAVMVLWGLAPLLPALKDDPSYLCSLTNTYSPISPVPFEGLVAPTGEVSWFPIGIRCHYWAGEGLAAVTNEIDWLATQVAADGLVLIIVSPAATLWLYMRETRA